MPLPDERAINEVESSKQTRPTRADTVGSLDIEGGYCIVKVPIDRDCLRSDESDLWNERGYQIGTGRGNVPIHDTGGFHSGVCHGHLLEATRQIRLLWGIIVPWCDMVFKDLVLSLQR